MLLACIAVCMSNMSFSLHGFSVIVPCQTHSFSQPSLILSPQNYLLKFKLPFCPLFFTLSALISGLLFLLSPSALFLSPPPPYLVHKVFERCFLYSVPLSGRLRGLGSVYLLVEERQGGDTSTTNTKQYPDVHPPFCFLQWEASSTKDIQ